jgi:hypothetical protein
LINKRFIMIALERSCTPGARRNPKNATVIRDSFIYQRARKARE